MTDHDKKYNKRKVIKKAILGIAAVSVVYGAKRIIEFRQMAKLMWEQMVQRHQKQNLC